MPITPDTDFKSAAEQAVRDAVAALTTLGKAELTAAAENLNRWAPAAARWTVERQIAKAAGDDAKLDELDRNFEIMAADAVFALADAGVLAQTEGEKVVTTLLSMLGKFAVAAVIAV